MDTYKFGEMIITWLDGGITAMDGGAMFGVVPKPLWSKKYPANEKNQIELPTDPILVQYEGINYLIDTGVGHGKLSDKQKRNFGVPKDVDLSTSLQQIGLTKKDIDVVLMTHLHFDHAGGLTEYQDEHLVSAFPNARIVVNAIEWDEMRHPNIRSKNTYWKENWQPISDQIETYQEQIEIVNGIKMFHTGGHSKGHAIIKLVQGKEVLIHMADIMPTHAHQNVLWVLAYDDYPMDSIKAKKALLTESLLNQYSFIFYHDAYYRLVKWDQSGKEIVQSLPRSTKPFLPLPSKSNAKV